MITKCPNCGATIFLSVCERCGAKSFPEDTDIAHPENEPGEDDAAKEAAEEFGDILKYYGWFLCGRSRDRNV
jgi:hypothetical protein